MDRITDRQILRSRVLPVGVVTLCALMLILFTLPVAAVEQGVVEEVVKSISEQGKQLEKEKAEKISERPKEKYGRPTQVYFNAFIIDIDGIDDVNQNFNINLYITLRWKDARLIQQDTGLRSVSLQDIWNPRLVIANQQGRIHRALPEVAQIEEDGTVIYRQRFTGTISQPLKLGDFPMDAHTFGIQFASAGYHEKDLIFLPEPEGTFVGGGIADELSLPDWQVMDFSIKASPYRPVKEISTAGFVVQFEAQRIFDYYIWQIILPLTVVIVMSWGAFWVHREQISIRIGIATSSVLTLIAHRFVLASLLPKLPYMTRLDYFTMFGTLLVLLGLVMVIVVAYCDQRQLSRLASRLDLALRGLFPLVYGILLIHFLAYR